MTTDELVAAQIAAQATLRAQSGATIGEIWRRMPGYDAVDVPLFLDTVVPLVIAAQRRSVALTSAFLARRLQSTPLAIDAASITDKIRGGVEPREVYRRPFVRIWTDLKAGKPFDKAVAAGLDRAKSAAAMDVQLAMRQTLVEVARKDHRILGFRRVPDPGACDLCLIASTQRYRTDQLMPIHNHCGCGVDVITGAEDVGRVIDPELLKELKASGAAGDLSYQQAARRARQRATANRESAAHWRAESASEGDPKRRARLNRRAVSYDRRADAQQETALEYSRALAERRAQARGITVAVRQHGELGPLLVNGDDHFTAL